MSLLFLLLFFGFLFTVMRKRSSERVYGVSVFVENLLMEIVVEFWS